MKFISIISLVLGVSALSSANESRRPDSNILEPSKCPANTIAKAIQAEFEKEKSLNLKVYKVKSIADSTQGRAHNFERLAFLVERSGTTELAVIDFDSSECKIGHELQFFGLNPVSTK